MREFMIGTYKKDGKEGELLIELWLGEHYVINGDYFLDDKLVCIVTGAQVYIIDNIEVAAYEGYTNTLDNYNKKVFNNINISMNK